MNKPTHSEGMADKKWRADVDTGRIYYEEADRIEINGDAGLLTEDLLERVTALLNLSDGVPTEELGERVRVEPKWEQPESIWDSLKHITSTVLSRGYRWGDIKNLPYIETEYDGKVYTASNPHYGNPLMDVVASDDKVVTLEFRVFQGKVPNA